MLYPNINFDRSERVVYDKSDYQVYIRKGKLSAYPNFRAESHWHDDLEFILVLSGNMQYNINGEMVTLGQGEGIFVNTRQLHFGYSEKNDECIFICILLHPILLCSSQTIEKKYIAPILFNDNIPFYHLTQKSDWETKVLYSIKEIYDAFNDKLFELKIQREFYNIWIRLCENIISIEKKHTFHNHHLSALKDMISYMNRNYREKIDLSSIARAGKVGKTGCCAIFKKYINKSPNEFLTDLRLRKGIDLLRDTDMTVLEISCEVGFSGASYFTETFHKYYGCSPKEYRKSIKKYSEL